MNKETSGKVCGFTDLPLNAISEVAKRMSENRVKYDRGSHTQPFINTEIVDAIFRHLIAYCNGETLDGQTSHLTAIACNALMLEEQRLNGSMIENRLSVINI